MHERRGDEITFIGMAGLGDVGPMEDFVERHGLGGFPHLVDDDGELWARFGMTSRSTFAFVDDDGSVARTTFGVLGEDELERRIDELLAT